MNIPHVDSKATGFQKFTPMQYIKMDIAKQFSDVLDKDTFESRLQWFEENQHQLDSLVGDADEPALYLASLIMYREAITKRPTGGVVGFDSCSSGPQLMSAAMSCIKGCEATGLVIPNVRTDAYSLVKEDMAPRMSAEELKAAGLDEISRKLIKQVAMPVGYGSREIPKKVFGDKTPAWFAFYESMSAILPSMMIMSDYLINRWNPNVDCHRAILPDLTEVDVKVLVQQTKQIEVQELGKARFSHMFTVNAPKEYGVSLVANVAQITDAFVLSEMVRRCNYEEDVVLKRLADINTILDMRDLSGIKAPDEEEFLATNLCTDLSFKELSQVPSYQLMRMETRLSNMIREKPFEVFCVHDDYKCSPMFMNTVRYWYKEICAELCESTYLQNLLRQLLRDESISIDKPNCKEVSKLIRNSNYSLS